MISEKRETTIRTYEFLGNAEQLDIQEDPSGNLACGIGSTVWDSALVLSKLIEKLTASNLEEQPSETDEAIRSSETATSRLLRHIRDPEFKCALELGAGTGLVSMVFARCFPKVKVYATDKASCLPLLEKNILKNRFAGPDARGKVVVRELDWEKPFPTGMPSPDLILLSDCIAFEDLYDPLVTSIGSLSSRRTMILMAYETRNFERETEFFRAMREAGWVFKDVKSEEQDKVWNSEEIYVFIAWKAN
ncbi:uncharacterized protein VTP21DRAFT_581 [Calcarisporiella thermophila]|uniref:uncharacterized protein n=1 Tax=Calcarisporiella thermophila TaxID=911321 RepID=UPI003744AD4E